MFFAVVAVFYPLSRKERRKEVSDLDLYNTLSNLVNTSWLLKSNAFSPELNCVEMLKRRPVIRDFICYVVSEYYEER